MPVREQEAWRHCVGPAAASGAFPPPPPPPQAPPPASPPPEAPAEQAGDAVARLARECLRHGRAAAEARRLEEALAWFDRALALDAGLGIAHFCRAMILADLGRPDEAHDALERSTDGRGREDAPARVQLARLLARHGHYTQSLRVLGPALSARPELAELVQQDRDFRSMRDHPFFLQMVGAI